MADQRLIEMALCDLGVMDAVSNVAPMSGGCIHGASIVTGTDGTKCVVKIAPADQNNILAAESDGLNDLAQTQTVLVPKSHGISQVQDFTILAMEFIDGDDHQPQWNDFGDDLARLHNSQFDHQQFGYRSSNFLGRTPQINTWCDSWVEFNALYRLGYQQESIRRQGCLSTEVDHMVSEVIGNLDQFIPARPPVSLLHGDLWSGNAVLGGSGRIAVIDPACSFGDGWADIAMMRLFGGFPDAVFEAYASHQEKPDQIRVRLAVYQLYHVLNHVNLFGRSYLAQTEQLCKQILSA